MNKLFTFTIVLFFITTLGYTQKKDDVILTINNQPVTSKEFKRVYKKNLSLVKDDQQKTVDGYLDLFIDYKLKVAEAYAQKLDTLPEYIKEFSIYEGELSRNYIYDDAIIEDLVQEAYDRSKEEIDASHILINCNFDALPQDTLIAYNKIKKIRERVLNGEDFAELAKKLSDEPRARAYSGRIGYFTSFSMVYPFETVAYNTKVGEVSEIARTRHGYHIIKVHDRRDKVPQIAVSHIMVSTRDSTTAHNAEERINEMYALIQQGENFESVAKQYSDDKYTGKDGGRMSPFTRGDLKAPPFENASYELENPGDISKPIQTRFGWHIIKLNEKFKLPTFEEQEEDLKRRVNNGARSKILKHAISDKIKSKHNFKQGEPYFQFFMDYVGDEILERKWEYVPIDEKDDKLLFTIGNKKRYFSDLSNYIKERQSTILLHKQKKSQINAFYDEYEIQELKSYFRKNLEMNDEEYASIISEYREGLLIFDVMNRNVWEKVKQDTIDQEKYYNTNIENYYWKKRVDAAIYSTSKQNIAEKIVTLLGKDTSPEKIKEELNNDGKVNVIITEKILEEGDKELPENFEMKSGISNIYTENDNFIVIDVDKVILASPKEFEDIKGKVLSDYQQEMEKKWIEGLRNKYDVKVNKKALKRLKRELK